MNPIRFTAIVAVVALFLSYSPRSGHAGDAAAPTAKTCFFVRNHLPCPCPKAQQARALAHAARLTAGALGSAIGTTVVALSRADASHAAPVDRSNASPKSSQR